MIYIKVDLSITDGDENGQRHFEQNEQHIESNRSDGKHSIAILSPLGH